MRLNELRQIIREEIYKPVINGERIFVNGKIIGKLILMKSSESKKTFVKYCYEELPQTIFNKLPEKFNYIFIDKLLINKNFRHFGIGKNVLKQIGNLSPHPLVISMFVKSYMDSKNQSKLENYYISNGFKLFTINNDVYGIKIFRK